MSVLWGSSRQNWCKEVVLTLLAPGHLVDPLQAIAYRRLMAFQRLTSGRPDLHDPVLQGWGQSFVPTYLPDRVDRPAEWTSWIGPPPPSTGSPSAFTPGHILHDAAGSLWARSPWNRPVAPGG